MKKYLDKDSAILGVVATLVSTLLCAGLLWLVLVILRLPMSEHARWFAVAFVPSLLLLRYYAKEKVYPTTLKAVISTFFVTFVLFMWFMLKYKYITLV